MSLEADVWSPMPLCRDVGLRSFQSPSKDRTQGCCRALLLSPSSFFNFVHSSSLPWPLAPHPAPPTLWGKEGATFGRWPHALASLPRWPSF